MNFTLIRAFRVYFLKEERLKARLLKNISRETVRVILQEHDLKPWRQKSWCVPDLDDEFVERMKNVLAVYENEHTNLRPLLCIGEKPIQLLADVRPE